MSLANGGEAIPAADLPHLFERFYRVEKSRDRAHGGAGIGLAIVKQLVEGWGGRVGAESVPGLTRFWFSLPQGAAARLTGSALTRASDPQAVGWGPSSARRLMPSIWLRISAKAPRPMSGSSRRCWARQLHAHAEALDEPRPVARLGLEDERPGGPEARHVLHLGGRAGRGLGAPCRRERLGLLPHDVVVEVQDEGMLGLHDAGHEPASRLGRHHVPDLERRSTATARCPRATRPSAARTGLQGRSSRP